MEPDFSGYATKAGLRCSDGRTISADAFQSMHGKRVPLVWNHGHGNASNILGRAELEARSDGVYARGYFNGTKQAEVAKELVRHGDIDRLSIYANQLVERAKTVLHGAIREVSLVLSGANPGAVIDFVSISHSDGDVETLDDEAIIHTGMPIEIPETTLEDLPIDDDPEPIVHADGETVKDVYDRMPEEFKTVLHYMLGVALDGGADGTATHSDEGDEGMVTRNIFETRNDSDATVTHSLSHSDMAGICERADKIGSMKAAVEEYALAHGIDSIDVLFPDARNITGTPEFDKRRTEWVAGVLNGTKHSPFARIKTLSADITHEEARAKGYVKGTLKKEEFFKVAKRTTGPTTIYKKQKLDRDDIIDITDFDVVAWMKGEMRLMLEEELARAILIGDGREVDDPDHIDADCVRPISNEHELYCTQIYVNVDDANSSMMEVVEAILRARKHYKGTGTPTFYTTETVLTEMLLTRDTTGRRLWRTTEELAQELRVSSIVPVEPMEDETDMIGIIVNLLDYNIGADRGGDVSMFDDFDIDYNQLKYLLETRVSGALTKIKAALVIRKVASTKVLATPTEPTYVTSTGVVTIPTVTGVVYKNADTGATLSAGAQTAITVGSTLNVTAAPATGYYFDSSAYDWSFFRRS